ncbi:hypothetical protein [Erwinia mallotivora]|uniref:hypothetical protein n=1 Tax=Erwinia mallotivora TaxID=69222 RepID=UPI0021BEEBC7|nr:hypothetical protein [Erwinia mallotivora]
MGNNVHIIRQVRGCQPESVQHGGINMPTLSYRGIQAVCRNNEAGRGARQDVRQAGGKHSALPVPPQGAD